MADTQTFCRTIIPDAIFFTLPSRIPYCSDCFKITDVSELFYISHIDAVHRTIESSDKYDIKCVICKTALYKVTAINECTTCRNN